MANSSASALATLLAGQQSLNALQGAKQDALSRYQTNYYDPFTQAYSGAPGAIADAYGLNGAAGNQRAQANFQAAPGYQFQLDQGLQALNRNAASRGMLASGNNTQDILKYSQGLANQGWGQYLSGLGGLADASMSAAQGQTNRQGSLANIDTTTGTNQANVWNGIGNNLASLYQPQQQQQSGIGPAIAGGLQLGGSLLGGGGLGSALGNITGSLLRGTGALSNFGVPYTSA